jgi:hypothetical protein
MKEFENLRNKLDVINQLQPYVGSYFSSNYIRKSVLKMTDQEIEDIKQENEEEPPQQMQPPSDQPQQPDQSGQGEQQS